MFVLSFQSCSSNNERYNIDTEEIIKLKGTKSYIVQLGNIVKNKKSTRNLELEQDKNLHPEIPSLLTASIRYLELNNIDYEEFFEDKNDVRIIIFAECVAELQWLSASVETRTSLGGCILEAIGLNAVLKKKAVTKVALKQVGKAILKKSIPYAGWAILAVDMAWCLYK